MKLRDFGRAKTTTTAQLDLGCRYPTIYTLLTVSVAFLQRFQMFLSSDELKLCLSPANEEKGSEEKGICHELEADFLRCLPLVVELRKTVSRLPQKRLKVRTGQD